MKTTPVTPQDLARSVLAVPPLALTADLDLAAEENRKLARHIEAGGVTTLLYGGNANLHNWPVSRFGELLAMLEEIAAPDSWVLPSVGPEYGKLVDEARIARNTRYPTLMALPMTFPQTPAGIERGLRDFVQISGKPLVVYIKAAGYLPVEVVARLIEAGEVCGIKYAVPRPDLTDDPYLADLVGAIGPDRVVSGAGELVAVPHLRTYGLAGFTAGCVCIAPRLSMAVLRLLQSRDFDRLEPVLALIRPLEQLREKLSLIRALHEAVTLSGIARMGPILPLLSNMEPEHHAVIAATARALLQAEERFAADNTAIAAE
jgi:dihydrodipicolinate synthase/N-acetylneuraminate lyase